MVINTSDLAWALSMVGGFLVAVAGIAALIVWIGRRRSPTLVIDWTLALSAVVTLLALVAIPVAVVRTLTAPELAIELPIRLDTADLPCTESAASRSPELICAYATSAHATIAGLSVGTRLVIALGLVLAGIMMALPAAAVAVLCFESLRGRPFHRTIVRTFLVSAVIVLVAGIGGDLTTAIGQGMAAGEVLPPDAEERHALVSGGYQLTVPLWPIGATLALAALAAVFRYGARLQRDTDLLV